MRPNRTAAIAAACLLIVAGAVAAFKFWPRLGGAGTAESQTDPCALLTDAEIEAVQGEPARQRKASRATRGTLNTSQCYFALPTFSKSVSLFLTERGAAAGALDPKDAWRKTFSAEAREERAEARDKQGEERERRMAPDPVPGLGDEAFWLGAPTGGALHVLVGDRSFRISVGGSGTPAEKKDKSIRLARAIAGRLGGRQGK
jgi:hypothetical protein